LRGIKDFFYQLVAHQEIVAQVSSSNSRNRLPISMASMILAACEVLPLALSDEKWLV